MKISGFNVNQISLFQICIKDISFSYKIEISKIEIEISVFKLQISVFRNKQIYLFEIQISLF